MNTENNFPKAVCALIYKGDLFLSVSRKDDPTSFGLPGGKVDPDETLEEACRREVFEETGLRVFGLRPIFTQVCGPGRDGRSFETTTFAVNSFFGKIATDEEGIVGWVSKERFFDSSPFADYNKELFAHLGI